MINLYIPLSVSRCCGALLIAIAINAMYENGGFSGRCGDINPWLAISANGNGQPAPGISKNGWLLLVDGKYRPLVKNSGDNAENCSNAYGGKCILAKCLWKLSAICLNYKSYRGKPPKKVNDRATALYKSQRRTDPDFRDRLQTPCGKTIQNSVSHILEHIWITHSYPVSPPLINQTRKNIRMQ